MGAVEQDLWSHERQQDAAVAWNERVVRKEAQILAELLFSPWQVVLERVEEWCGLDLYDALNGMEAIIYCRPTPGQQAVVNATFEAICAKVAKAEAPSRVQEDIDAATADYEWTRAKDWEGARWTA